SHCDRWDKVFIPGNPNTFLSSKADVKCDPSKVTYIASIWTTSSDTLFGPVHVGINGQTFTASGNGVAPELKGLLRETGKPHEPPDSWGFEQNVMGSLGIDIDGRIPR